MSSAALRVVIRIIWLVWSVVTIIGIKTSSSVIKDIAFILCILFIALGSVQIFMDIIKTRKENKEQETLKKTGQDRIIEKEPKDLNSEIVGVITSKE